MSLFKVLYFPHVLLKKKSTPVEKFTDGLRDFIKNLIETAYEFEGGGIAAPQVGVNKRIFVADFTSSFERSGSFEKKERDFLVFDKNEKEIQPVFPMVFVNPEILEKKESMITDWEGCLSFPGVKSHNIERFHYMEVHAQNEFGEKFSVKTTHLYAAVNFQHEIDHLDGLLMSDRWNKNSFSEKEIAKDIKDFLDQPEERRRIKKLKLLDANKIKFDFL